MIVVEVTSGDEGAAPAGGSQGGPSPGRARLRCRRKVEPPDHAAGTDADDVGFAVTGEVAGLVRLGGLGGVEAIGLLGGGVAGSVIGLDEQGVDTDPVHRDGRTRHTTGSGHRGAAGGYRRVELVTERGYAGGAVGAEGEGAGGAHDGAITPFGNSVDCTVGGNCGVAGSNLNVQVGLQAELWRPFFPRTAQ